LKEEPSEDWQWGEDFEEPCEDRREAYQIFLASSQWNRTKWEVMARDKFKCTYCGKPAITAHHLRYDQDWVNKAYVVSVCGVCHAKIHGRHTKR
jgi:5-methylcytosine-specific restriction endonuclease McrA